MSYKSTDLKDLSKECYIERQHNRHVGSFNGIMFKGVCLWSTIYSEMVDGLQVALNKYQEGDFTEYAITGKVPVHGYDGDYDFCTYGGWDTEEEALEWLANPKPLY